MTGPETCHPQELRVHEESQVRRPGLSAHVHSEMTRRRTAALIAGLLVLLVCGGLVTAKYRLLWRRHGVYPVDQEFALARGGSELFLIDRRDRVT